MSRKDRDDNALREITSQGSRKAIPKSALSIPASQPQIQTHPTSRLRAKSPEPVASTSTEHATLARVSSNDVRDVLEESTSPLTPATPSKHKRRALLSTSRATANDTRWQGWARDHPALRGLYDRNRGVLLVLFAQVFGTLMNVTTRLLETSTPGIPALHPFQILFARMSITLLLSLSYMYYTRHPEFPFGNPSVRYLLIARGFGGFFGVFGMYMSLRSLPLAEATVLSFLAPGLTAWVMSLILKERFGWAERGVVGASLGGVVCIARPSWLFGSSSAPAGAGTGTAAGSGVEGRGLDLSVHGKALEVVFNWIMKRQEESEEVSPQQRLFAVGMGMVGVLGATAAYTTIRLIGNRAHPLISITYFSGWSTFVSTAALTLPTGIPLLLPRGFYQWGLLIFLGVNGFIMQFLLTSGLRGEKSSRSTMMVYSQMIFALAFDWGVWGVMPDMWSWIGGGIILGSAISVAFMRDGGVSSSKKETVDAHDKEFGDEEEAAGLVDSDEDDDDNDDEDDVQMTELNGGGRIR